jgi:hypothetical protein
MPRKSRGQRLKGESGRMRPTVLLRLAAPAAAPAIVTSVLAPTAAVAQPPCIPSPSIPPGTGNQCGPATGPGEVRGPAYGPPTSSYSRTLPVAAPLDNYGYAGNALATFQVPVLPTVGVVRVGLFIAERTFYTGVAMGYGNDREFDGDFDANHSKLTLELNYITGQGTAWATPSCAYLVDIHMNRTSPDLCHAALPLEGNDTGSTLLTRQIVDGDRNALDILYSAKLSFVEAIPGARSLPSAISGELRLAVDASNNLCVTGEIDAYPSVEIYRYQENEPIRTIYRTRQSHAGPLVALAPPYPNKTVDECTGALTEPSP